MHWAHPHRGDATVGSFVIELVTKVFVRVPPKMCPPEHEDAPDTAWFTICLSFQRCTTRQQAGKGVLIPGTRICLSASHLNR